MGIMGTTNRDVAFLSADRVEAAINEGQAFATELTGRVSSETQALVKKSVETVVSSGNVALKRFEEQADQGRANFDALVAAGNLAVAGFSEIARAHVSAIQMAFDAQVAHAKALSAVKSVKDAADLQLAFAKAATEQAINHSARTAEQMAKLSEKIAEPVLARVTATLNQAGKPLAA